MTHEEFDQLTESQQWMKILESMYEVKHLIRELEERLDRS